MPTFNPFTKPTLLIVATLVLLLLQTPPSAVLARVVVLFKQTLFAPVIAGTVGVAFTVIICEALLTQVVTASVTVYLIVVPPKKLPVTTPAFVIDATNGVKLLQTPPLVASDNVIEEPTQTLLPPVIGATVGKLNTVTVVETVVVDVPTVAVPAIADVVNAVKPESVVAKVAE